MSDPSNHKYSRNEKMPCKDKSLRRLIWVLLMWFTSPQQQTSVCGRNMTILQKESQKIQFLNAFNCIIYLYKSVLLNFANFFSCSFCRNICYTLNKVWCRRRKKLSLLKVLLYYATLHFQCVLLLLLFILPHCLFPWQQNHEFCLYSLQDTSVY